MDNKVRIFRDKPFGWFDKPVMRYLRHKYGSDKKTFVLLRSVYLALCEIESDFSDAAINFFTETVGTYAGVSREVAGKYIRLLEKEGLISQVKVKDDKTGKFITGTYVQIKSLQSVPTTSGPLPGYPGDGIPQRRDNRATIKNISSNKKVSKNNNVKQASEKDDDEKIGYYARLLAEKLDDMKSLTFYKLACQRYPPTELLRKAHEIVQDGGARNPAAVFVDWFKTVRAKKGRLVVEESVTTGDIVQLSLSSTSAHRK